jgi:16S rRNA (cytidine1402-2'-O)-methyltransferase
VDAVLEQGLVVEVLPGPSAIITALVASGLPTHAFYFGGFLPRKAGQRVRALEAVSSLDATLVFYESPHRVAATLRSISEVMPSRRACVARELTKLHEEVARGDVEQLVAAFEDREVKGEVVLLVGPPLSIPLEIDESAVAARIQGLVNTGASTKDAVKTVAEEMGLPRNEVYRISVENPPMASA